MVKPGARAPEPFVDFRRLLAGMPADQQAAAVGASVYRLLAAKVIPWDEAVTPARVRTLQEIVSRRGLSVRQMVRAGVKPRIAEAAHGAVHTQAHEHAERQRRELIDRILKAGLPQEALVRELSNRLAARVGIAEGAAYTTRSGEGLAGIRAQRLPGAGAAHAAELAQLLGVASIARVAMGPKPAKPAQLKGDELIRQSVEVLAGMGIETRVVTLEELQRIIPDRFVDHRTPAMFDERSGVVYIIRDQEYWTNPKKVMAKFQKAKWLSSYTPEHLAIHEGIHAKHLDALTAELGSREQARERLRALHRETIGDAALRARIQKVVGRYAAIDPSEFVAEVGTALREGKTYPDWVMELYRKYHGPPVVPDRPDRLY